MTKVTKTISIPISLLQRVIDSADAHGISLSAEIVRLVEKGIDKDGSQQ